MAVSKSNRKRVVVGSSELRQQIAAFLNRAAFDNTVVVIERNGFPKPIAVLVSYEEYERLADRRSKVAKVASVA